MNLPQDVIEVLVRRQNFLGNESNVGKSKAQVIVYDNAVVKVDETSNIST